MNKFEPDGVSCISNWGGIEISLNIDDSEISWKKSASDYVKIRLSTSPGDIRIVKIQCTRDGRPYVRAFNNTWYLEDFMRVGVSHE